MGGNRGPEEKRPAPTTPDNGPANGQGDEQAMEKTSIASQQHRRWRFLPRLRKRRTTDSAEPADATTERAAKGRKVGLVGIVITALVGFFFGIGSNQVTDYVKRADDCVDGLSQFLADLPHFAPLSDRVHDQALTPDQHNDAGYQYETLIVVPHIKIVAKCPVNDSSEYLNSNEVKRWNATFDKLANGCFLASECSWDNAVSYVETATESTSNLEEQALQVARWGLVRRAKYEITHLY